MKRKDFIKIFAAIQIPFMTMGFKFNVYVFFGILAMAIVHITL